MGGTSQFPYANEETDTKYDTHTAQQSVAAGRAARMIRLAENIADGLDVSGTENNRRFEGRR